MMLQAVIPSFVFTLLFLTLLATASGRSFHVVLELLFNEQAQNVDKN